MNQREQIAITSRVFCLAAIFGLSLILHDPGTIQVVVAVCAVGGMSAYVGSSLGRTTLVLLTAETLVVAILVGLTYPKSAVLLPYLVLLPLLAGLFRRIPGVLVVMLAEIMGLLVIPLAAHGFVDVGDRVLAFAPWIVTNFGGGLVGVWARTLDISSNDSSDDQYESARQLLTQLRTVARRLSAGLDSEGMAAQLMATLHEYLEDSYTAVFANMNGSVLVPLAYRGLGAQQILLPTDPMVQRCWAEMEPVVGVVASGNRAARHRVVLPLRVGHRMIGVAVSSSASAPSEGAVAAMMREVDAHSLRLDTALVFDEIRTLATADERQRIAREIHDGIAQEVASLGYVVDHMASTSKDPTVAEGLRDLRRELSRVVADLRLSIFDLRSDVSATNGLGAALSDYVRQVGAKSDLTVHLTLNEASTRLSPAVEAELLRIAQEAVTNARKHASAHNLWVDVWTDPPLATLTVRDDGRGIHGRRDDSYGISIMRERANRIDATLEISNGTGDTGTRGTVVNVKVAHNSVLTQESR
ncbi:MAG TPA: histidine kinase [Nocardioidaceae bacterium]|nr:histidine kinase [Nocardioidaceae bacterium]